MTLEDQLDVDENTYSFRTAVIHLTNFSWEDTIHENKWTELCVKLAPDWKCMHKQKEARAEHMEQMDSLSQQRMSLVEQLL